MRKMKPQLLGIRSDGARLYKTAAGVGFVLYADGVAGPERELKTIFSFNPSWKRPPKAGRLFWTGFGWRTADFDLDDLRKP